MYSSKAKAYFAILLMFTIIGFNPLMLKITVKSVTALEILTYRLSFGFICALIPVVLRKVKIKITFRDFLIILPAMIAYAICFFTLQTLALETLPSTESGIIFALSPILAAILAAIFLKEKTNGFQILFIIISMTGVIFIMLMKGASAEAFNIRGTILMALTTITFAATSILLRRLSGRYPAYTITFLVSGLGFVAYNAALIYVKLSSGTIGEYLAPLADWRILLAALFLGCGGMFGTSFLQSYALKELESTKVVVFSNLSTAITIFAGAIFLTEPVHWYHVLGTVVIIVGVIGTNWSSSDAREKRRAGRISSPGTTGKEEP